MKKILVLLFVLMVPVQAVQAEYLISAEKALKKIFRKADYFKRELITLTDEQVRQIEEGADIIFSGAHSSQIIVYKAYQKDVLIGFAYEDTVQGKWGPIHYMAGLDKNGSIIETIVLDYQEIRGKPVARRRFLKQYRGKNIKDRVMLRRDIDGITGATISSRSMTDGVRKILYIHTLINP